MFGSGRPEEIFVGIVAGVLAIVLAVRIRNALIEGVIPLYRIRKTREEMGEARFLALVAINGVGMLLLGWIAIDLILLQR